jgi:hypothetical protein
MGYVHRFVLGVGAVALLLASSGSPVVAGGFCAGLTLSCENGQSYSLCPIAVSDQGEIVTAQLGLSGGRGVHVRLVPMGVGYRYIGRNIWVDGVQDDAILYLGKHLAVACKVVRG